MAKKMKVVVRRKEAAAAEQPSSPGSCFMPFMGGGGGGGQAKQQQRQRTPRRKRGAAGSASALSSNASSRSDPLVAKESASSSPHNYNSSTMDFNAWESFHQVPEFPAQEQSMPTTTTATAATKTTTTTPVKTTIQQQQQQQQAPKQSSFATDNTVNFSVSGETASTHALSRGSSANTSASRSTIPPSPDRSVEQLLTLPAPVDRSDRRRLQYEREKRQKGLYQGELEPVGTRGQEAQVKITSRILAREAAAAVHNKSQQPDDTNDAPQIRSFAAQPPATDRKNFAGKQVTLVLPALKDEAPSPARSAHSTPGRSTPQLARGGGGATSNNNNNNNTASSSRSVSSLPPKPPATMTTPSTGRITPAAATTPQQQQSRNSSTQRPRVTTVDDASSEDSSRASNRDQYLPPVQLHTGTGKAIRGNHVLEPTYSPPSSVPPVYFSLPDQHDDDESTQSDEELRQMQPDLMPTFSMDMETNQPHVVPSQFQRPSPAAAAAAAAAAATLQQQKATPAELVEQYNAQAMGAVQEGRLDDAVELFSHVLSMQKAQHGDKHPAVASAFHNLGTVQAKRAAALSEDAVAQQLCRTAALEAFQAAARTARDSLGPTHPNVAVSLVRIGFLLLHSKQYANALITFAEALRIRLTAFGKNHALTANLYNNLGVCHMHLEEFDQGRRALHTGLAIQRKLCAESDAKAKTNGTVPWLELADTLFNIGGLCLEWIRKLGPDLRRAQESEDAFAEAYEVSFFLKMVERIVLLFGTFLSQFG